MSPAPVNQLVNQLFNDNWPIRRRVLFLTLIWLAGNVEWLIWKGLDGMTVQLSVTLIGAAVALIVSYVFGAVWDDNNKRVRMSEIQVPQLPAQAAPGDPCAPVCPDTTGDPAMPVSDAPCATDDASTDQETR